MIHIEKQIIEHLTTDVIEAHVDEPFILSGCMIESLDLNALEFSKEVIIENCIINSLTIYCSWFAGGLKFANNIVISDINYEMGGHNNKEIELAGNIFKGFFRFFDCQFDGKLIVKDNIFMQGSDLFTKENKGFANDFANGFLVENNIGKLDVFI